jgi:pyruvate carboxylase
VANRGEIAVRAFRAAYELGAGTVAVFPHEDRNSVHRLKADESYQIGEPGHPVRAYLDVGEIVRAAQRAGADAGYPGYGFRPDLAEACARGGDRLRRASGVCPGVDREQGPGDRRRPGGRAAGAGLHRASSDLSVVLAAGESFPFPLFVKAVAGGGAGGCGGSGSPPS